MMRRRVWSVIVLVCAMSTIGCFEKVSNISMTGQSTSFDRRSLAEHVCSPKHLEEGEGTTFACDECLEWIEDEGDEIIDRQYPIHFYPDFHSGVLVQTECGLGLRAALYKRSDSSSWRRVAETDRLGHHADTMNDLKRLERKDGSDVLVVPSMSAGRYTSRGSLDIVRVRDQSFDVTPLFPLLGGLEDACRMKAPPSLESDNRRIRVPHPEDISLVTRDGEEWVQVPVRIEMADAPPPCSANVENDRELEWERETQTIEFKISDSSSFELRESDRDHVDRICELVSETAESQFCS